MSYLTSHINKVRTGEEANREAEEDRLTFDRWWLVNPWGTTLPARPESLHSHRLLLSLPSFFLFPLLCCRIKPPSRSDTSPFCCFFFSFFPMIAWQRHLLDSSSSGEVVLKCCATLATSPAADPQAYRETNPFILASTFRWGGGRLLHCFTWSMFSLLIDVHILIWSAELHLKELKRKRSKVIGYSDIWEGHFTCWRLNWNFS